MQPRSVAASVNMPRQRRFLEHDDVENELWTCQMAVVLRGCGHARRLLDADSAVASSPRISFGLPRLFDGDVRDR
jgi:hypothetical protein